MSFYSGDGVPFLMRDRTLRRTTDVSKIFPGRQYEDASLFNWTEIRSLNAGQWFLEVLKFSFPYSATKIHFDVFFLKIPLEIVWWIVHKGCLYYSISSDLSKVSTVKYCKSVQIVYSCSIYYFSSKGHSAALTLCCFHLFLEWPLLDGTDPDSEGPEQNWQPVSLQSGGNAASGSQVKQLCTTQHPETPARAPPLPELVHGHALGCAEIRDSPEEGESCRSMKNICSYKAAAGRCCSPNKSLYIIIPFFKV